MIMFYVFWCAKSISAIKNIPFQVGFWVKYKKLNRGSNVEIVRPLFQKLENDIFKIFLTFLQTQGTNNICFSVIICQIKFCHQVDSWKCDLRVPPLYNRKTFEIVYLIALLVFSRTQYYIRDADSIQKCIKPYTCFWKFAIIKFV